VILLKSALNTCNCVRPFKPFKLVIPLLCIYNLLNPIISRFHKEIDLQVYYDLNIFHE
ncbi:LOW QUALITY PROTEIN: hypothetical protein Smp_159770, partial [Schistosoma mansoni]|uniref:hypothetical protein n=1 Tax=Schistosoma mansoni TaxID=6183 RepID=UPI00022DC0B9